MAAINPPNKVSTRHRLREDQVVTVYMKAWAYFDRNRTLVYGLLAGLVVIILLIIGYVFYMSQQQNEADQLLAGAVAAYERGDFRTALDGTGESAGLIEIVDDYGRTQAGNLAAFYAADALYNLGEYDQALEMFEAFDKEENLFGASAIAGEAAVYETQGEHERAAELYSQAASFHPNELTSPQYIMHAARAYEQAGMFEQAVQQYEELRETYPESTQAASVDFFIARVEARQTQPS